MVPQALVDMVVTDLKEKVAKEVGIPSTEDIWHLMTILCHNILHD